MKVLIFLLTIFSSIIYASATNKEHVLWDKIPIPFIIPIGQERIISFPDSVTTRNTDLNLTNDKLSILNNQGTLYIKAKKDFEQVRIAVTLQKTGEVVLVDISAKPNAPSIPVEVILKDEDPTAITSNTKLGIDYVSIMRTAIQELYAPQRLIEEHSDVKRTPMYTDRSIALFWGLPVIAMPIASWTANGLFVTAVIIKNVSKRKISIELGAIKGNWLAASFYPSDELSQAGTKADRTTLFLVSGRPFAQAYSSYKEVI